MVPYRLMTNDKKALLIENMAHDIEPVILNVKSCHCTHCLLAEALIPNLKMVEGLSTMT